MNKTPKTIAILVIVAGLLYLFVDYLVVATVNGTAITRIELMNEMEKQMGNQALQQLVQTKLIEKEVGKLGVEISEEEISQEVEKIRAEFEAQGQGITLDQALLSSGINENEFREQIKLQISLEKHLIQENNLNEIEDETEKQNQLQQKVQEWVMQVQENSKINILKEF